MSGAKVREAVGVFHDEAALRRAADELLLAGFDRAQLSLLTGLKTVREKLHHDYDNVAEIEDDPGELHSPYVGSDSRAEAAGAVIGGLAYVGAVGAVGAIVASGGTLAAALIGAAAAGGAGGLIGTALARFIDHRHAQRLHEQLDRGGLLLWVRTEDAEHEKRACDVLERCGAEDVHVHELPEISYVEHPVSYEASFMKLLGL